jgi:hypothetical protein
MWKMTNRKAVCGHSHGKISAWISMISQEQPTKISNSFYNNGTCVIMDLLTALSTHKKEQ